MRLRTGTREPAKGFEPHPALPPALASPLSCAQVLGWTCHLESLDLWVKALPWLRCTLTAMSSVFSRSLLLLLCALGSCGCGGKNRRAVLCACWGLLLSLWLSSLSPDLVKQILHVAPSAE